MEYVDPKKKLDDLFGAFRHTSEYKDRAMLDIMCNREKYEQHLDEMWRIFKSGNMNQVFEYRKQVATIKEAGLVVKRHKTTGKHKIVYPEK